MNYSDDEKAPNEERIKGWLDLDKLDLLSLFGAEVPREVTTGEETTPPSTSLIFLSYARADQATVEQLYDRLKDSGFTPWMDVRDLYAGENWEAAISLAIERSDFFVLCLSSNSVNHRGVLQREIKAALDRHRYLLDDDIFLVPVRLSECPRPRQITTFQTLDLFEPDGYDRLLQAFRKGIERRKDFTK